MERVTPLQLSDSRAERRLSTMLEKVFGIKDFEDNPIAGVTHHKLWARRSSGEMRYDMWCEGSTIGYLIIGENSAGRVVMTAETPTGEVIWDSSSTNMNHAVSLANGALHYQWRDRVIKAERAAERAAEQTTQEG